MKRLAISPILPILMIGIVGACVAVISRSSADNAFVFRQQNLTPITPGVLDRFVASAPDPRPGDGRHRGMSARCLPKGHGELRNPWICVVRYPIGGSVLYRVNIDPTGHVLGVDRTGQLLVEGCCVGYRPTI